VLAAEAEKARAVRSEALGLHTTPAPVHGGDALTYADPASRSANHGGPRELAALESNRLGAAE
jgi:hypothetical protein